MREPALVELGMDRRAIFTIQSGRSRKAFCAISPKVNSCNLPCSLITSVCATTLSLEFVFRFPPTVSSASFTLAAALQTLAMLDRIGGSVARRR